jgi:hypothetical protein
LDWILPLHRMTAHLGCFWPTGSRTFSSRYLAG